MLKQASRKSRNLILLQFTKELIRNSGLKYIQSNKQLTPSIAPNQQKVIPPRNLVTRRPIKRSIQINNLVIPEPRLPPRFQYLRPVPKDIEVDLEKLNPLLKDPMVKTIECNGPGKKINVRTNILRTTNIILNKEEIDGIIKKFSDATRIPIQEGIFKVVLGRLILTAIISNIIGSKFIIRKMAYRPPISR
ncbi:hypothetical protein CMI40_02580 [Candidatus Pacearchaeota archaeon]|jgi:hypothetical protein|nr:hypothetical protein [Candidatus Pacearchaeota archaeon]|tara:strand:- start:8818 stop:9390 length:573 start_codon:yes stop_codon:yes gene_type:complete